MRIALQSTLRALENGLESIVQPADSDLILEVQASGSKRISYRLSKLLVKAFPKNI